jgi:hypothetical protein
MGRKTLVRESRKPHKPHVFLHEQAVSGFAENNEGSYNARNNPCIIATSIFDWYNPSPDKLSAFTLTHLSTEATSSFSTRFKSNFSYNKSLKEYLGLQKWNIVKIPGKTAAKAETSNSTLSIKAKNYPYARSAGVT